MDGNGEEIEVGEWELVQNDEPIIIVDEIDSNSAVIRPDHFSLNPQIPNSNSSCSSNSEIDRNFDDSYVANQLFPNPVSSSSSNLRRWNDSDSDSDATTTNLVPLMDAAEVVEVGFDSKEEEEVKEEKENEKRVVWWKVPFEVLKHWVAPLSLPLSVAAAATFLGLLILGRRLYEMKRKTQTLKLNLALDDKVAFFLLIF